mgnify:CR=1 FL=1
MFTRGMSCWQETKLTSRKCLLLGFQDATSFYRAFRSRARTALTSGADKTFSRPCHQPDFERPQSHHWTDRTRRHLP